MKAASDHSKCEKAMDRSNTIANMPHERNRWLTFLCGLSLTLALFIVYAPLALSQNLTGPSRRSAILEVQYDPVRDQLSIRAERTSLQNVLAEISRKARVSIEALNADLPSEEISAEIKNLPIEQALKQLLRGINAAFLYSSAVDPLHETTPPRLVKVILSTGGASKQANVIASSGNTGTQTVERQANTDSQRATDSVTALLRAVVEDNSASANALIAPLNEPGRERERDKAVAALLETLNDKNFPAHYTAMAALDELAPEKASTALAKMLQGNDQEMRVIAATGLGQLGDQRAIQPLMSALNGNDPLTRQIAADSLARIGGEMATDILVKQYLAGDPPLKQAIAGAIAFHADEKSQTVLANIITSGLVSPGATPQDTIASTLPVKHGIAGAQSVE
jgi:hypothetical protein